MKAERRHELQTNSLALWLRWRAPQLWQEHGTKFLLGLVVILAALVLINWRIRAPRQAAEAAERELANARAQIQKLQQGNLSIADGERIKDRIQGAIDRSDRPEIRANAHAILGDYFWAMANPPMDFRTIGAPQPSRAERDKFLDDARRAYETALADQANQGDVYVRAHLGLAAIDVTQAFERDRQAGVKADPTKNPLWDRAREHYKLVLADLTAPQVLKDEASWQMDQIARLQKPVWLAPPPPATTQSTSQPALEAGPSTRPAAPTTAPAASAVPAARATTRPAAPTR